MGCVFPIASSEFPRSKSGEAGFIATSPNSGGHRRSALKRPDSRNKMMSSLANICVVVFLVLFAASVVMQFIRAKKRQNLVRIVDASYFDHDSQSKWQSLEGSLDFLLKDFRKLQVVKKNSDRLPENLQVLLNRYRHFSRAEMLVTGSMLLFGITAHLWCNQ